MAAAQAGDAVAYRAVLNACLPITTSLARRMGVHGAAVDDVVQDVLLTVHRALPTYDPARPFAPWLGAIIRRRSIDIMRSQGRRGVREVYDPDAYLNHPAQQEDADLVVSEQDEARKLRAAISTLPSRQRQAVEMLGLQENSLEEASQETGQSKVALKVSLHRAIRSLRDRLGAVRDG